MINLLIILNISPLIIFFTKFRFKSLSRVLLGSLEFPLNLNDERQREGRTDLEQDKWTDRQADKQAGRCEGRQTEIQERS